MKVIGFLFAIWLAWLIFSTWPILLGVVGLFVVLGILGILGD